VSLLDELGRCWLAILASALIAGALAYAASYLMSPAYRAEVIVFPVSDSDGSDLMAALGGQLAGLGALAGLGISGDYGRNERLAVLSSRQLAVRFIEEEQLVPEFCTARLIKCSSGTGTNVSATRMDDREANDTRKLFQRRVLSVSEDKRTGLVRVTMTWRDREKAADWASRYIALANRELLARSIAESDLRIEFLRTAAAAAEANELRLAIYNLMESEIKSRMVASSRVDYAFRVIDPALVPDERDRVRPKRALIAVIGAGLGTLSLIVLLMVRSRRRISEETGHRSAH
jgi:uncharacterized protein involved in exopolysaccharide biosynthesis